MLGFADALLTGRLFLLGFWSFLLFRKLRFAYRADRWIRLNSKVNNKRYNQRFCGALEKLDTIDRYQSHLF